MVLHVQDYRPLLIQSPIAVNHRLICSMMSPTYRDEACMRGRPGPSYLCHDFDVLE